MKIALVSIARTRDPKNEGGLAWYTEQIATDLARAGHLVYVIANKTATPSTTPGITIIPTWQPDDLKTGSRIIETATLVSPDVVHVQHELFLYGSALSAYLFPHWLRALAKRHPTVLTVHGVLDEKQIDRQLVGNRLPIPTPIIRFGLKKLFQRLATSNVLFTVNGEIFKERLVRFGAKPQDVFVINLPGGLSAAPTSTNRQAAREMLKIPPSAKVVLSWGFDNSYKGFDLLAEGFALFAQRNPDARLLLGIGKHPKRTHDPKYISDYLRRMAALETSAQVSVVGFIPEEELGTYLAAADILVFAYTKFISASGPLSIALHNSRPVLTSSVFTDVPAALRFDLNADDLSRKLDSFFKAPEEHIALAMSHLRLNGQTSFSLGDVYELAIGRETQAP